MDAILRISLQVSMSSSFFLGTGVTHSRFMADGHLPSLRQVFIIFVRGLAKSSAHSILSLSGISIGKVDFVFPNFFIFSNTWSSLTCSGRPAGRKAGSCSLHILLYSWLTVANDWPTAAAHCLSVYPCKLFTSSLPWVIWSRPPSFFIIEYHFPGLVVFNSATNFL